MIWKGKERYKIRVVQMDKLRSLLGIRRMDTVPNARIRELCGMAKGVKERIEKDVLQWFSHIYMSYGFFPLCIQCHMRRRPMFVRLVVWEETHT